jgi:hypothetical protein
MRPRSVIAATTLSTVAVLTMSAQAALAAPPSIGQIAAAAPSQKALSLCVGFISEQCEVIPAAVVSTTSGFPANDDSAANIARAIGLTGSPSWFAYCPPPAPGGAIDVFSCSRASST